MIQQGLYLGHMVKAHDVYLSLPLQGLYAGSLRKWDGIDNTNPLTCDILICYTLTAFVFCDMMTVYVYLLVLVL